MSGLLARARAFYDEHEPACTVGFFVAGFLFDALAVGRIDELRSILQQALYLFLCAWFTSLELRELYGRFSPPPRLAGAWRYHAGATHFMLGTLLNIYTLFYFKSASLGTSLLFLIFLAGLLAINELKPFGGTTLRMTLFSLCLVSYFTYLVPLAVGRIGALPFAGSLVCAAGVAALLVRALWDRVPDPHVLRKHLIVPFATVEICFAALYALKIIPPVPLSLSGIGVYHDARRDGDHFVLTMTRPRWKFWQRGDQTFLARSGDQIHLFISVFSPTRFKDRLELRWLFDEPGSGWQQEDVIPVEVLGGRGGGFRTDSVKSRYKPGRWRVEVETSDDRELGRIDLTVEPDASTGPRNEREVVR